MFRPFCRPAQERMGDAGLPDWSSPALSLSPLLPAGRGGVGGYESPGCSRLLCAAGRRGWLELERETRAGRLLGNKTRSRGRYLSLPCVCATQKRSPRPFAASINTLCLFLVLLSPDTDLGVRGDTQCDTWPLSCCGGGWQGSGESRAFRGVGPLT